MSIAIQQIADLRASNDIYLAENEKLRAQCKAFRDTMAYVCQYIDAQESVSSVAISNTIGQVLLKNPEL